VVYVSWEQFNLQDPCNNGIGPGFCSDFVDLIQSSIDTSHLKRDSYGMFCGDQPTLNSIVSSQEMKVRFISGSQQNDKGFLMNFLCANLKSEERGERNNDAAYSRFRQQVGADKLKDTEIQYRGKKFAISTTVRTQENCMELGGFSPPPRQTVS